MTRPIVPGSTDQSITVRFADNTTGLPKTGLTDASAGLALWYRRQLGAKTTITPASLAALTTAHTDGGFKEIGDGTYRLDLPDAAVATGSDDVVIGGTVTGAFMTTLVVIPLNFITQANVQQECEDALVAKGLDHLVSASVTGTDVADNSIVAKIVSKSATADWDDFVNTTDSLQGIVDSGLLNVQLSAAGIDAILDDAVEGSYTLRQYLRGFAAVLMGKLAGASGPTTTIRDTADSKNRITATVDASGNRTAVTLDLT